MGAGAAVVRADRPALDTMWAAPTLETSKRNTHKEDRTTVIFENARRAAHAEALKRDAAEFDERISSQARDAVTIAADNFSFRILVEQTSPPAMFYLILPMNVTSCSLAM
jgi:hypothetical protein